MTIALWIGLYVVLTGVCVWLVLDDGETIAALVGPETAQWSQGAIRLFAIASWLGLTIWFVLGLVEPTWRL